MTALEGRVALVTGSSRGIGRAIASLFAEHGACVALHGRDRAALAAVQEQIAERGGEATAFYADVTRWDEIEPMRERVERELGPVELLVANAGGSFDPPGPIEDITEAGWRAALDGNLTATFLTLKSFLPGMKQRGRGAVITISSAAARRPHVRTPKAYAAAKIGLELLTQNCALDAGPFNVRVNCIAPETILTESNQARIPDAVRANLAQAHPLKRLGTPDDIAQAALFLASESASWITGAILDVAGGAVLAR